MGFPSCFEWRAELEANLLQVGTDNADEHEKFSKADLMYDSINFLDASVLPEQTVGLAKIFEELGHFQREVKDDPDIDLLKVGNMKWIRSFLAQILVN